MQYANKIRAHLEPARASQLAILRTQPTACESCGALQAQLQVHPGTFVKPLQSSLTQFLHFEGSPGPWAPATTPPGAGSYQPPALTACVHPPCTKLGPIFLPGAPKKSPRQPPRPCSRRHSP